MKSFVVTVNGNKYQFRTPTVNDYNLARKSANGGDETTSMLAECLQSINGETVPFQEREHRYGKIDIFDQAGIANKFGPLVGKSIESATIEEIRVKSLWCYCLSGGRVVASFIFRRFYEEFCYYG